MQTVLKFRRYMLNLSALLLGVMDLVMSLATILLIGVYQGVREQISQRNHPYLVATQRKSKKPNPYGQFNEFDYEVHSLFIQCLRLLTPLLSSPFTFLLTTFPFAPLTRNKFNSCPVVGCDGSGHITGKFSTHRRYSLLSFHP